MNDFLEVLIDVERHGIKVDLNALDEVEKEFRTQHTELEKRLKEIISNVMGHTPINLGNPEHISWILHSVKVNDKNKWKEIFNLGSEERNGVKKAKYVKRYHEKEFRQILKENCSTIKRTIAKQCPDCNGMGVIQKYCNDGRPRKNKNICHTCERRGVLFHPTSEIAGFRLKPISSEYAADGGFSTGKETLDELLDLDIPKEAREFIELYKQYNAVSSYLSTFVDGIRKNVRGNSILHTSFNQCVTATGRLSSTRPNLQNQPRESTFPIRKVFVSRFANGKLLNADFKQLEFRVAAYLAQCTNAIKDIKDEVDVHQQTADAITAGGEPTSRQDAKKSTFRPLYGGTSGTKAQLAYFDYFFKRYDGIFRWHNKLCEEAISKKYIQSPSGRIYAFPFCTRRTNGSITNATQVKNYNVQGFATGDILPVTMIEMYLQIKRLRKEIGFKSVLCLTVHDSIVADTHPEEHELMVKIFKEGFVRTIASLKERFNIDFNVPLDFDLESGYNLLQKEKIKHV
jgi:DNA polymerase I-like protein with 3'-5' exonuclease and polymerase domains